MRRIFLGLVLLLAACSSAGSTVSADPPPETTTEEIATLLVNSTQPVVLTVWASWCVPCRTEAPLLSRAWHRFGDEVRFIGLNVGDTPGGAARFIGEFFAELDMEHYADPTGVIPIDLGGSRGVPLTFFYHPGGELSFLRYGVIDERTLALQIDELVRR